MEWNARRTRWIALAALAALVLAAGAWWAFAPKPETMRDDAAPAAASALAMGALQDGAPLHTASGTVALLRDADGYVLRFEGYDATPGPDVFFYLTKEAGSSSVAAVEGEGVRIDTDTMSGQATLRGAFNVRVPEGVDPTQYAGLAVWCQRYDVLFGWAELAPTA